MDRITKAAMALAETSGFVCQPGMLLDSPDGRARCETPGDYDGWPVLTDWATVGALLGELEIALEDEPKDRLFVFELEAYTRPDEIGVRAADELRRLLVRQHAAGCES